VGEEQTDGSVMKKQILSIQVLRAIAAWLVVMHHMGKELDSPFANFFAQQGNFGVDIFFVISGFIIYHVASTKDHGAKTFIMNRVFRLIPAYWIATLLLISAKFLIPNDFSYTDWSFKTLISSLFFIPVENPAGLGPFPPLVVGWTLNIEVFFYAVLCACFIFGRRFRFFACAAILLAAPVLWDREWFYGAVLGTRKLYEFVFGIMIGSVYLRLPRIKDWLQARPAFGIALIPPAIGLLYLDRDGMRLLAAGLIVSAAIITEGLFQKWYLYTKSFVKLGEISYSTYLLHYIMIGIIIHFLGKPKNSVYEIVEWLVLTTSVFIVSYLGYKYVETNPWIDSMRKKFTQLPVT
jgi:peptidoglycan/LPS O-acetylase OafA/YrhL